MSENRDNDDQCTTAQDNSATLVDNFYRGRIVKLDRGRGCGVVRSASGRKIPFQFPFVEVVGAKGTGKNRGIELLFRGAEVGFDVSWTSRGLRVCTIKPLHRRTTVDTPEDREGLFTDEQLPDSQESAPEGHKPQ